MDNSTSLGPSKEQSSVYFGIIFINSIYWAVPVSKDWILMVHTVQQKKSGLKFSKSRTGIHVTYSCHHNSSRFTFPIFVHSWRFSVFHSLQSIALRVYLQKTPIHSLNLKLKHELKVINFPRRVA